MATKRKSLEDIRPNGQPCKWKPEYNQKMLDWFNKPTDREVEVVTTYKNGAETVKTELQPNNMPTFTRFALELGVDDDTLENWAKYDHEDIEKTVPIKDRKCPGFFGVYNQCKKIQKDFIISNGLLGLYNSTFAIFTAKNLTDMRDKVEQDIGVSPELLEIVRAVKEILP